MTRILCACHSHLGVIDAQRRFPELRGGAVIVGEREELRLPVVAVSRAARSAGARPGQPLRQAQQLCPAAAFVALDQAGVSRLTELILEALTRLAPAVETGDEEVYCDLSGRHAAFAGEGMWAAAVARALMIALDGEVPQVGVAGSRLVARQAALGSEPHRVRRVPEGEEATFLAPLPVGVLDIDPAIIARLTALGIERLGAVARLTAADLQRQFGAEGLLLSRLARGQDGGGLTPWTPPRAWRERLVLEGRVADLEMLGHCCHRCADTLGDRLQEGGLTAGRVTLTLELEGKGEGTQVEEAVEPPVRVGSGVELWPVVATLLGRITVAAPVVAIRIEVTALGSAVGRQIDMWRRGDASRDLVIQTASRLCGRFGDTAVRRPRLLRDPGDIPEQRFTWEQPAAEPLADERRGRR